MKDLSALVIAVGHAEFDMLTPDVLVKMLNNLKLVVDVKSRFNKVMIKKFGIEIIRI